MRRNTLAVAVTLSVLQLACGPVSVAHLDGGESEMTDAGVEVPDCNQLQQLPCFEMIWVDGLKRKMRFFDVDVKTNPPTQNFYVTAPQSDTPQGIIPFQHDHVTAQDTAEYWHGYLVLCSEQGLTSGACVSPAAQGSPPLAATVYGQRLKTVDAIEIAKGAGLIMLFDTAAVLQARVDLAP